MGPRRDDVEIPSTVSSVIAAHALQDQAPERPLRVGLIAPPWVPVPPPVYGGTELVIDLLARGLIAAGHHVVLVSTGDATCPVDRRWRYPQALGTTADFVAELAHVETAYRQMADVDVIHDHTMTGPTWAELPPDSSAVLTTVHGPFTAEFRHLYATAARRGAGLIAISHHQRRSAPEVPIAGVIHHGVDVNSIPVGDGDGGYVLFLGRMHPDKGALREGAAPEIIDHGSTGFLCIDEDELAANLSRVGEIKRSACRAATVSRFSTPRTVNDHVSLYRRLATAVTDAASRHPFIPRIAIGS